MSPPPADPASPTESRRPSRLLRAGVVALLLLPVLLLAALWYGPRFTDWNEHRDRLAILAAGRLGQRVTLAGPVQLTLLPQPMLEAGGVTIGGPDDDISIKARALRLRLDLPALLGLRLEPREVALVGAEVRLPWPPVPAALPAICSTASPGPTCCAPRWWAISGPVRSSTS